MKKFIISLTLLLTIGIIGYGVYMYNKKTPGLENTKADYQLTANQLFNAFEEDEQSALKKFEGKVVDLSGKIARLNLKDSIPSLTLEAENSMFGGVNCSFSSQIEGLEVGDTVKLRGKCQGFLMDVVLNNCTLID